jgi:glycosyltransferase involved in cell wall biosynthesis
VISDRVRKEILGVITRIGAQVDRIYVVDDCCPDGSGGFVESNCTDERVKVIRNSENQRVGGAVMTSDKGAIADGIDIIVKVDGDGQMYPGLIPDFVARIPAGEADYTKGNHFLDLEEIRAMPKIRLFRNAALSNMFSI